MIKPKNIKIENDSLRFTTNGVNYEELHLSKDIEGEIIKAPYSKNWLLLLIIGIGVVLASGFVLTNTLEINGFNSDDLEDISLRTILTVYVSIFSLFAFGVMFIILAIRKDYYLVLIDKNKEHKISIGDLYKNKEVKKLVEFLKANIRFKTS